MTEIGEGVAPSDAGGEGKDEEEEKHCPACGAVWKKTEPTLAVVRTAIREAAEGHRKDIQALGKGSMYGYCGSVATGVVGNPSKVHHGLPPDIRGECGTKYDIDGYIVSGFASKVKAFRGKRWASRHADSRKLESVMRKTHQAKPALAHMRGGKSGFSIVLYLPKDGDKATRKGGVLLIF